MSILDQSGHAPDWTKLQPPNGRTVRGMQRVWGEIKREIAAAASGGNADSEDASPVGNASASKLKGDASPAKAATQAKEKAVRKPRAKNGGAKTGRKRGNGNLEITSQDDEEPALKKNKLSEDENEKVLDGGKEKISGGGKGRNAGSKKAKKNLEEEVNSEDIDSKYDALTIVKAKGGEASATAKAAEGGTGVDVMDVNGDGDTATVFQPRMDGVFEVEEVIENSEGI
ncbi:hypothetical protein FGG08_006944 [Glutinoglossum americanum]|uniref:Uncharacterized protein n=1 Tax=Glutinoglossum americanum TaxID=1670608 RepID=A0A9P8I2E7_9PEZI|nr:hypothetical protein FGG08_006944 [Glutinoglossum americanum]